MCVSAVAGHLKLFQNPDPKKSELLVQLNFIRRQLVTEIAANISGKTMSESILSLLATTFGGIKSKDIAKLEALIQNWDDIKTTNESVTSLKV